MKIILTQNDIINLKIFMLTKSKTAKKQRLISYYAIPFEFILVGIFIDGIFNVAPIVSIISVILAILWMVVYPKLYKKMQDGHIKNAKETKFTDTVMNFKVDENFISFSSGEPKPNEKFETKHLKTIEESKDNYFLGFKNSLYIVLPKNDETLKEIKKISLNLHINLENIDL